MQYLTNTYYAVEILDPTNGLWYKPANWQQQKKWITDRVRQLRQQGHEVRVKEIKEYREETVIESWDE